MQWFENIKEQNKELKNITETIGKYNQDASRFKLEFQKDGVNQEPQLLDHMTDFEGMQRRAFEASNGDIPTIVPSLLQKNQDYENLKKKNEDLEAKLALYEQ